MVPKVLLSNNKYIYCDLREEAQKTPYAPPFPWIEARLKQLGLEVYRHNFTLNYPLGKKNQVYKGKP